MSDHETIVDIHIRANSLAELRDKLAAALGDLAPQAGPSPALVAQAAAVVADAAQAVAEQVAEAGKPKRTRKVKEAPAEATEGPTSGAPIADTVSDGGAPAPSSNASPAETSSPSIETGAPTASFTHEQAKAAAEKFMAEHPDGKDQAKKEIRGYLATYGVSRVAELAAKDLPSFMTDLEGV